MLTLCLSTTCQKREEFGIVWHALEHQRGAAIGERPIHDIGMAGDPTHIGRTPINVTVVIVEDQFMRHGGIDEIAA